MLRKVIRQIFTGARSQAPTEAGPIPLAGALGAARENLLAADFEAAERHAREAARIAPDDPGAWRLLGATLAQAGRLDEARAAIEQAVRAAPDDPGVASDLGNVLRLAGDAPGALACYGRTLARFPADHAARLNRASLLAELGRDGEALDDYRAAIGESADPTALHGAMAALDRLGRAVEARALCEQVLAAQPDHAEAHASLGFVLLKRELAAESALPHLERAIALDPADHESCANLGIALQDLGRVDDAIEAYDAALALRPDHHVARFHRALARLLVGDFGGAWPDYELRLLTEDRPLRRFAPPRWQGEDLAGSCILVHAEQGLGDEIMFASCLPDLLARARSVVVDCSPKLGGLFSRSFPQASIHAGTQFDDTTWVEALPPIDYVVPAGSLPLHFRPDRSSFPDHRGYLVADPARVARWRARLDALGPGRKIGLSWRGGMVQSRRPLRSLDPLRLAPLVAVPGTHFVSLQYDARPDELEPLAQQHGLAVHDWTEIHADYEETAALVAALDLVVSVCTAVIHLGGALGRPVWVLAPFSPEWRYGLRGEAMPWYPSVRVLRQPSRGDWDSVISAAVGRLQAFDR